MSALEVLFWVREDGLKVKINSGQCGIKAAKFCFEVALFRINEAVQCGIEAA